MSGDLGIQIFGPPLPKIFGNSCVSIESDIGVPRPIFEGILNFQLYQGNC